MRRVMVSLAMVGMLLFGIASYAAGEHRLFSPSPLAAADDCQTFSQTGKMICGDFLKYWQDHGGLAQQGYPISDVFDEKSETDGITHKIQYFERAVFEAHPENQPPNNVLLSLLGSQKFKTKYGNNAPASTTAIAPPAPTAPTTAPASPPPNATTGRRVADKTAAITLQNVQDPAPKASYGGPKAGNRCVALDITVENIGSDILDYNPTFGALRTSDDRQFEREYSCSSVTPQTSVTNLNPGDRLRTYIVFEIPSSAVPAAFIFDDYKNHIVIQIR